MSLAILFHFLCAQHVSDINISIIRSLWLFCWITTLVVLFLVRCVNNTTNVVIQQNSRTASACNTDTTPTQPHRNANTHRTKNNTNNVVIQQNSRKLPMMDILMSETCYAHKKWNKIASDIKLVFYSSTIKVNKFCFYLSDWETHNIRGNSKILRKNKILLTYFLSLKTYSCALKFRHIH